MGRDIVARVECAWEARWWAGANLDRVNEEVIERLRGLVEVVELMELPVRRTGTHEQTVRPDVRATS